MPGESGEPPRLGLEDRVLVVGSGGDPPRGVTLRDVVSLAVESAGHPHAGSDPGLLAEPTEDPPRFGPGDRVRRIWGVSSFVVVSVATRRCPSDGSHVYRIRRGDAPDDELDQIACEQVLLSEFEAGS